jgi:hypothetical protein
VAENEAMEREAADRSALGEGRYANYFEIGHNAFEFLLDLGQLGLETEPARIYVRVITSPSGARQLCELLNEALAEYWRSFGAIRREDDA